MFVPRLADQVARVDVRAFEHSAKIARKVKILGRVKRVKPATEPKKI